MKWIASLAMVAVVGIGCAMAQEQQAGPAPQAPAPPATPANASAALSPGSSVDEVLDALDAVGRDLKDFTGDVALTETDNATADSATRRGKVWYQRTDQGDARMRVNFDLPENARIEYMLDKGWLIDRDYRKRIQVNRQVLKPGERINLLKLGEGPFPFPVGQKKEDVHRQFTVARIEPAKDDPSGTVHLQLTPNPGTQFERKFSTIDVWVDQQTHLPRRIATVDKNLTTTRTVDFENLRLNGAVKDADFVLAPIDESQWQRHDEPYRD